jgi:dienelactone hydrolase
LPYVALVLLFAGISVVHAQQPNGGREDSTIAVAKAFVGMFASGDDAKCVALFDTTMKALMPESKVKEARDSVFARFGPFKAQLYTKTQKYMVYDIVFVTCQFERDRADVRVVLDASRKVAGLFFSRTLAEYRAPAYVKRETFREEEVIVGSGKWALHGTLTLPTGAKSSSTIVLVHGSGPNDRDEAIGPNKPFRDLAWGLASNGVAVLRYEKRTKEHGPSLIEMKQTFTVKDEAIDDALAAVDLLRKTEGIDTSRIFVLGHSLGGMLVPRIGLRDPHIAGFVLLAGAARPLEDMLVEQISHILSLSGVTAVQQKKQVAEIEKQRDKVKRLTKADTASADSYFAAPASYWIDLQGYDPPQVAKSLTMPLLILQGERDYQVTMKDFDLWKAALQGRKSVTFKSYSKLNHLFLEGEGMSGPAEYENVGHVEQEVIEDIARWLK